jgi:hypothetical protein
MDENLNLAGNTEIEKALKEFEAKSKTEQKQKVPEVFAVPKKEVEGVQFETPSYGEVKFYNETDTPKIVKLVMKFSGGSIKEQKQAEYVLLGFVVLAIIVSGFLFYNSTTSSRGQKLSPEQQSQMLLKIMPQDRSPVPH